jgi:hypothetical protein
MQQKLIFEVLREIIYNPYSIKDHRKLVSLLKDKKRDYESLVFEELINLKFKNENNSTRN